MGSDMHMHLLEDRSDEKRYRKIIRTVLKNVGRKYCGTPVPRWSHVADLFGVGSTTATELCLEFELDPNEKIGDYECSWAGQLQEMEAEVAASYEVAECGYVVSEKGNGK